jgi:hypothetical protein
MTDANGGVMDALTGLEPGDDVTITVERNGEELELDGHVVDAYREEPEKDGFGYVSGSLDVDVELANSAVRELQEYEGQWLRAATHSVDIHVKESRPGLWSDPSVSTWDPETENGTVVQDSWTGLGELRAVEASE